MSILLIKDYLQTQGMRLPEEEVRIAHLAAQTVMNAGQAAIEHQVLWYENHDMALSDHIKPGAENEKWLKQVFMALDSVFSRAKPTPQSAAAYLLMPSEKEGQLSLVSLTAQGQAVESKLDVTEENSDSSLAVRTAQTGWSNIAADIPYWLEQEALHGDHNLRCNSQLTLPVATENGTVLGIVHVEYAEKDVLDDSVQTDWVALALALIDPLKALLKLDSPENIQEDIKND